MESTISNLMLFSLSLSPSLSAGPTTVTTTDQIRYLSVGKVFEGAEIKIDDPDSEGQGEVCIHVHVEYMY